MSTKITFTILILITLGLAGLLGYNVYKIKIDNQDASMLENKAKNLNVDSDLAQSIRDDKTTYANELSAFDQITLTQDKLVPFIELVESTAKAMGLQITIASITPDKPDPTSGATPVEIQVETTGSWAASFGFIHAVENLPERVSVSFSQMTVTAGSSSADSTTPATDSWHTNSTIIVYSFN